MNIIQLELHNFNEEVKQYTFSDFDKLDNFMETLTQEDLQNVRGYAIFENGELVEACFRPRKENEK